LRWTALDILGVIQYDVDRTGRALAGALHRRRPVSARPVAGLGQATNGRPLIGSDTGAAGPLSECGTRHSDHTLGGSRTSVNASAKIPMAEISFYLEAL
jgi:hypothetical protein